MSVQDDQYLTELYGYDESKMNSRGGTFGCCRSKINILIYLAIYIAIGVTMIVGVSLYMALMAHEVIVLVRDNKEIFNKTLNRVYHLSVDADNVLTDLRGFVEHKVINAICSAAIIRKTVGPYLCANATIEPESEVRKRDLGELRELRTMVNQSYYEFLSSECTRIYPNQPKNKN